jgi:hypothetical protein
MVDPEKDVSVLACGEPSHAATNNKTRTVTMYRMGLPSYVGGEGLYIGEISYRVKKRRVRSHLIARTTPVIGLEAQSKKGIKD